MLGCLLASLAVPGCRDRGPSPQQAAPLTAAEEELFYGPLDPDRDLPLEDRVRALVEGLRHGSGRGTYANTMAALANLGSGAVALLGSYIQESSPPPPPSTAGVDADAYLVDNLCEVLGRIGDPAAEPYLLRALGHPTEFVRVKAIQALERLATAASVPAVIPLLDARDENLAGGALGVLLRAATPEALQALLDALDRLPPERRARAVEGLGAGKYAAALPAIRAFARSAGPFLRLSAGEALMDLGEVEEGMAVLEAGLRSERADVRGRALELLATRREDQAVAALRRVFASDPDPAARRVAAIGLRLSGKGDRETFLRIRGDPERLVRVEGSRGLAALDPEGARTLLLEDLRSGDPERRLDAVRTLRHLQDPVGTEALIDLYPEVDDPFLAKAILNSLAKIRDPSAIPLFLRVIREDHRRLVPEGSPGGASESTLADLAGTWVANFGKDLFPLVIEAYASCNDRDVRLAYGRAVSHVWHPETLRCMGDLYRLETDPGIRLLLRQAARELRRRAPRLRAR